MSKPSVRSSTPYATASNCGLTAGLRRAEVCDTHLTRNRQVRCQRNPVRLRILGWTARNAGSIPAASIDPVQAWSLRYWCTKAIAMLPSPTAAETRFTVVYRTSPQAKMPGRLSRGGTGRGRAPTEVFAPGAARARQTLATSPSSHGRNLARITGSRARCRGGAESLLLRVHALVSGRSPGPKAIRVALA